MTLDELKSQLINKCKTYYQEDIYGVYPNHTQHNIMAGLESGLDEMKTYITTSKNEFTVLKDAINALNTTDLLTNFHTDSDANMMTYVYGYLSSLTTDRQKMAIIIGLQGI